MDARVTELHCIMPLANISSILANGILSYERAAKLRHVSVAMQPVQDRRDAKQVPGGLKLHQYANLYFHARNPMLFKRLNEAAGLCVLRISSQVFGIMGVVISDQNAASDYARFLHPSQSGSLDFDAIYAADWRDADRATYFRKKSRKCAEVLVPQQVPIQYVTGAYVMDSAVKARLVNAGFTLPVKVDGALFFQPVGGT
ncbi:DUF4433 domain-containing protein [Hydrocarboniphaga sp.]|uniref:DUF4433 domain-containing protein n=1 Tax=Hydrocarboniphaga sp. TaxID=2033016 RepID=UPI003D125E03